MGADRRFAGTEPGANYAYVNRTREAKCMKQMGKTGEDVRRGEKLEEGREYEIGIHLT